MLIKPNSENWKVVDAQGKPVEILGIGTAQLYRPNGACKQYTLIVCPRISDSMLLSWSTQKRLGILPMGWPWEDYSERGGVKGENIETRPGRIRKATTEKTWPPQEWPKRLIDLCEAYFDVLVDKLRPQERLKVPDMTVTLKPGTKPFFCTRARPVPIHWKENTDKEKRKLL